MKTLQRVNIPKAVMEATFNWVYFYDEISPFVDEAILAHLLRSGLIPKAYTPGFETRDLRNLLRFRIALVKVTLKRIVDTLIL
ncbi:hypothetical protein DMNBHIDG_02894 [Candidatus Methanoperedenaceae archaeon GB37]|nr:hypothetical protein DMNBHIDG_02894 [Candidatus Methanoperedenaceae archaeon GB37]